MKEGAKLISEAIIGLKHKVVIVGGKRYVITPPTIKRIAGASYHLSDLPDGENIKDVLMNINNSEKLAKALSWFINGDETLTDDLVNGTYDEVVDALSVAYSMIGIKDFTIAVSIQRNVAELTAQPKL